MQTRALADKTAELRARHAAAVAALLGRYKQLRLEVGRYNSGLEAVMTGGAAAAADVGGGSRDQ